MNPIELDSYLCNQIAAFPCKTSLLMTDLNTGEVLHAIGPEVRVSAASTIKVPILLAALDQVQTGALSLGDMIPVPHAEILEDTHVFERDIPAYSLWELLYWMIVESDNTATNCVIRTLGYDAVNSYVNHLGLADTLCQRAMLDFKTAAEGRDNYTSAADQEKLYAALHRGTTLTPKLRETALNILRRQRCQNLFLRYIADPITVAHKTGGLDCVNHDAGIFYLPGRTFYLGVFTWDGPSKEGDQRQKMFIGRLAKAIYDVEKDTKKASPTPLV